MIFLLDLNYTLVANSMALRRSGPNRRERERYRGWLVDTLLRFKPDKILLVTIRHESDREWTLESIKKQLKWQPDESFFCPLIGSTPPSWKRKAMQELIFPKYGSDPKQYLSVESNVETHAMYMDIGIRGFKVFDTITEKELKDDVGGFKQGRLFS